MRGMGVLRFVAAVVLVCGGCAGKASERAQASQPAPASLETRHPVETSVDRVRIVMADNKLRPQSAQAWSPDDKKELRDDEVLAWRLRREGETRYLRAEWPWAMAIPGGCEVTVDLYDESGKKTRNWSFQTGWRIMVDHVDVLFSRDLGVPLIAVYSSPAINGRDVANQFYALSGDRLVFLRMEDSKGRLIDNNYSWPNHTIGPLPEANSAAGFIKLLKSEDPAEVLCALAFLGGYHMDLADVPQDVLHEDVNQAALFRDLCRSDKVAELVYGYRQSKIEWIKEAADQAHLSMNASPPGSGE